LQEVAQRWPVLQIELTVKGIEALLDIRREKVIALGRRLDHVAHVVVGVGAEAGGVVQIGALLQQVGQFCRPPRNLLVDVAESAACGTRLRDLLWAPERGGAEDKP
jgi:hypothetical protein